jgi:peroxiredoxin
MSITPGDPAPDSTWEVVWRDGAIDDSGTTISLSDYLGQVVVLYLVKLPDVG